MMFIVNIGKDGILDGTYLHWESEAVISKLRHTRQEGAEIIIRSIDPESSHQIVKDLYNKYGVDALFEQEVQA